MKKITLTLLLTIITIISLGLTTSYAGDYNQPTIPQPHTLPGPISTQAKDVLTKGVLPKLSVLMIGSVASISLLFLIIAGVKFAMVYGNEEDAEKAKKQVIYSLVGLTIALMSYVIVTIISNFEYEGTPAASSSGSQSQPAPSK